MDLCRICNEPSMVMDAGYGGKVPFRVGPGVTSFICGLCVASGVLRPVVGDPGDDCFDLRLWRKSKKLTQQQLASRLGVGGSMVSKVEIGEKVIPAQWVKTLTGAEV